MERWIMNRFGFVNFWVYDTEKFELSDGKLLLRGSNASGKSITTQSIIPYILDGDRQPTRLDPFGSKDRKMEYYLLGDPENGKEESTGYLYLEFVKPESRRYRTIGIGLHAKRGSKMNTWGFCILDEKRIGYDIMLYKNAGDQNIPVDSKNLREQLGDANIFVEKPTEYKAIVAKYIFGIEKENIDDFDLLTNILIKTRSSKLASKENMKPEQLYAILNDSLRPLSDEDLRPMAESMSRIQDIHQSIDEARSALSDVREIAREYDKYNRYMLWKKGEAYMAAKNTLDTAEKDINEKLDKISELEETLDKAQKDLSEHNMELQDLEREKDSLNYGDIERQLKDKADAAERIAIEKENEKDKLSRIKVKENSLSQKQSDIDNNECQIKEISSGLKEMISKLESREEYVPPFHTSYIRGIRFDDDFYKKSEQCRREIHNYRSRLEQVLEIIKERDEKKAAFDECAASCDRTAKELEAAESELKRAEELFDETKDELINNCHIAAKNNTEYIIDEQMLKSIEELVSRYEGSGSGNELNRLKYDRKTYLSDKLTEEKLEKRNIMTAAKDAFDEAEKSLSELMNASEPVPERSQSRCRAREILKSKGLRTKAFYECIDFREEIDGKTRAVLEAELMDMGILDALIVPRDMQEKAMTELGGLSDCIISVKSDIERKTAENAYFTVTSDDDIGREACRVLQSCCGGIFEAAENGYYRNGILAGHSEAECDARYIGAESRRKYREYQIEELRRETERLSSEYAAAKGNYDAAVRRCDTLDSEYAAFPQTSDINNALSLYEETKRKAKHLKTESEEKLEKYSKVKQEYENKRSETEHKCKEFPYRITKADYKIAIDEMGIYNDDLQDIISRLRTKAELIQKTDTLKESAEELEDDIRTAEGELEKIRNELHKCSEIIRLCDEFLNRPDNMDISARVQQITEKVKMLNDLRSKEKGIISESGGKISAYKEALTDMQEKRIELIAKENEMSKYFTEECELGLVITEKELTLKQRCDIAMEKADKEFSERSIVDAQNRLGNVFRKYSSTLAAKYNPVLGDCFEDVGPNITRKRNVITLMWESKPISPDKFEQYISEAIENDRLLVKSEEEQMFKETLMSTVSKKLYYRIDSSRRWVESMAELMKGINTSMGLSFSLTWKPKNDIGENELSFNDLNMILNKDKELISSEDYEKLSAHFRSRIEARQRLAEEQGIEVNYSELIRDVLDFRNWFEFRLLCKSADQDKYKELTVSRFHTFSGGERAMALYIPLFAAVEAQYRKAGEQAPHILALDEAFAGVDDNNISEMFGLLEKLGFGYIVNSQALWGCYDTVPALSIAELIHEKDSSFITVIKYLWNGRKKTLQI